MTAKCKHCGKPGKRSEEPDGRFVHLTYEDWCACGELFVPLLPHYTVDVGSGPECTHCGAGTYWAVLEGDDEVIGQFFSRKEDAEDLARYMNEAFERGRRNA
jgi:hypothetical protein